MGYRNELLLRSANKIADLSRLNLQTGKVEPVPDSAEMDILQVTAGQFASVGERFVALYRKDSGELELRIDDRTFTISPSTDAQLLRDGKHRTFILHDAGVRLVELSYEFKSPEPPLKEDWFSIGVDEEDFDFMLLVFNVLNTPGRRDRIYPLQS